MRDALSRGFRQIASYIFGRNMGGGGGEGEGDQNAAAESDPRFLDGSAMGGGTGEKIAMTSPVVTQMPPLSSSASEASASALSATETAKGYVVAFVMPGSKYKSAAVSLFFFFFFAFLFPEVGFFFSMKRNTHLSFNQKKRSSRAPPTPTSSSATSPRKSRPCSGGAEGPALTRRWWRSAAGSSTRL